MNEEYRLLNNINSPEDLRALNVSQLPEVCEELRRYLIEVLSEHPGHFGANLGTVELTVALHYVFNTPYDQIVWDVGHQAYSHKILTGRREAFKHIRMFGGISGFPHPRESEYDAFVAGHASNSISAALGMAVASRKVDSPERQIVAVIGDGAMTGGMAFEALNNASLNPNNLLMVLNDNHMAIDPVVGALSNYLVDISTSKTYNKLRYDAYQMMMRMKLLNEHRRKSVLRFNNSLKALLTEERNFFEGFSIRYFGPVDGHDTQRLVRILNDIKAFEGPKMLHVKTVKGKGFAPAEREVIAFHAPGKFEPTTGERKKESEGGEPPKYQDVFGLTLVEFAREDERIVGVTPAMPSGCSMTYMIKEFPKRSYDVGIAEGHAVTFSAGMAKGGLLPFCNVYSTFMQRAYDQLIHDVAMQDLHMVICIDRGGIVGSDGLTHHGLFDLAYMRVVPNLILCSPMNEHDLRNLMYTAWKAEKGTFVIRYPRGRGVLKDWHNEPEKVAIGKARKLRDGMKVAVLSYGPLANDAELALKHLAEEGLNAAHYNFLFLNPLDEEVLHEIGKSYDYLISVEDAMIAAGFGSAVLEFMADHDYMVHFKRIGIPNRFVMHGTTAELYKDCAMDVESMEALVRNAFEEVK